MTAREFYEKRTKKDNLIGSVQLMEEYAKHVIEIHLCDGFPLEFDDCSFKELSKIHNKVVELVLWVNE